MVPVPPLLEVSELFVAVDDVRVPAVNCSEPFTSTNYVTL